MQTTNNKNTNAVDSAWNLPNEEPVVFCTRNQQSVCDKLLRPRVSLPRVADV